MEQNPYTSTNVGSEIVPTNDERTMAVLAHVLTIVASFLAPLIIYLVKKDESRYIEYHAKESLNFQITMFIVCIVLIITIIGALLLWIVGILYLVFVIIATIQASEGKLYKYPFCIRLIK